MNERILLVGKGFLGTHIVLELQKKGVNIIATHHIHQNNSISLDITNSNQVKNLFEKQNPTHVINCAALGDVDFLQENKNIANKVNAIGAKNIAIACKKNKARLIHISTDAVFDGKKGNYVEKDLTNPVNVYGESKLQGEKEIRENTDDYVICRTNFFGIDPNGKNFFNWILNAIKEDKKINGFTDIVFSPLDTKTLSIMIVELLHNDYTGILHLAGDPISKFDFIQKVVKFLKKDTRKIIPMSVDDSILKAPRPKNTSLSNNFTKKILKSHSSNIDQWLKNNQDEIMQLIK